MRKQLFEELAKFYGIEIQYDSQKGGLYYADSDNIIKKIDTVFEEELYIPYEETISVEKCFSFDKFSIVADNCIPEAA